MIEIITDHIKIRITIEVGTITIKVVIVTNSAVTTHLVIKSTSIIEISITNTKIAKEMIQQQIF